jgi:pimeloyl-ACP methyl ester carboxylesterase
MTSTKANGITVEYETFGESSAPPVLLIMGLGAQMTRWDPPFCQGIADSGYFVIRFDNRDVGLSTWFDGTDTKTPTYSLEDMAADAAGLLDALSIDSAHVVGASMGGMIAQTFAIAYPERTKTLTSIMSTTGNHAVGQATTDALAGIMVPPPKSREEAVELGVKLARLIGSPGFPFHEEAVRERSGSTYDRAFNPPGTARQMQAITSQPDRTEDLGRIRVPTLVIHGAEDPLITPSGGEATAAAVPGATLKVIPGMGHNLPPELFDELIGDLDKHFRQA